MKDFWLPFTLLILAVVYTITVVVFSIVAYKAVMPAEGWFYKIGQASSAQEVAAYCSNTLEEMDKLGMAEGHYALHFKNQNNDVVVLREILVSLEEKAAAVGREYPVGSMDYAESLIEIKEQVSRINPDFSLWYLLHKMVLGSVFLIRFIPISLILIIVLAVVLADS